MAATVREFFETLEARIDPARAAGMTTSYIFDVEPAGRWKVDVRDGAVEVTEGGEEADATIQVSEETFLAMMRGDQKPSTAFLTGKLKVKGDMGAAMRLEKIL